MNFSFNSKIIFIYGLFIFGTLLGVTLATLAAWGDYESTSYGFTKTTNEAFSGLSCPILMTKGESGVVKVNLKNKNEREISPSIKTEISTSLTPDTKLEFFNLAPGESLQVEREIGPQNIDLDSFIFVKVLVFSAYPLPPQESTCGVFILPFSGNGSTLIIISSIISVFAIVISLFFLYQNVQPKNKIYPLIFIAIMSILAMTFSFIGWWLQAILMLFLVIITFFIALNTLIG